MPMTADHREAFDLAEQLARIQRELADAAHKRAQTSWIPFTAGVASVVAIAGALLAALKAFGVI